MQKQYEAPQLTVIGQASDAILGSGSGGMDGGQQMAPDFEFENDCSLS